ncbi:outer membrane protein assembly factor BamB [Streptomyces sp. PvR006]|uniref:outer membrane protein assembly factor BamB family protein n=1 Tax=Streptomyces sp. PvR006 TaxID=2817860 RepID=UPI001FD96FFB|nr:PQQ-binding-like beta-propeller repeat protein [Streptomyces sp. PvR006]MBP2579616.1 outer membrane protein assembly factor BamB [Streptomyces sp. PvR006]
MSQSHEPWYKHRPPPWPVPDNPYAPHGYGPPPPRPPRRRWPLVAAVLALLLLLGGGTYVLGERSGADRARSDRAGAESGASSATTPPSASPTPSPSRIPTTAEIARQRRAGEAGAWIVDDRTDLPRRNIPTEDLWIIGDTAVQAIYKRVVAHRLSDGAQLWSVDLPTPVCETPVNATPDGKVVIVLQNIEAWTGARCNQLWMIDLRTGRKGWHRQLTETGAGDGTIIVDSAISGGTVAIVQSMKAAAYKVADGRKLYDIPMENPGKCYPGRVAGGSRLLVLADCAITALEKAYDQVREIDPATGKVRWRYRTEPGRRIGQVLSVSPAVVTTAHRETHAEDWRVVALGPDGRVRRAIDPRPKGFKHCGDTIDTSDNAQACREAVVGGGLVLLGGTDRVGAYDLGTGKLVWGVKGEGTSHGYYPLRVGPDKTGIVYQVGTLQAPGRVFRIGPGGVDTVKDLLRLPASTARVEFGMGAVGENAYVGDRLVVTPAGLSGNDAQHEPRMLSFAP